MFGKYFGRFVATVLLVAVFSCTLFSCKSAGDESSSPASDASGSTVEVDAYRDENGNYKAALPDKDWESVNSVFLSAVKNSEPTSLMISRPIAQCTAT